MSASALEKGEQGYGTASSEEAKSSQSSWRRRTLVAVAAGFVVVGATVAAAAYSARTAKTTKLYHECRENDCWGYDSDSPCKKVCKHNTGSWVKTKCHDLVLGNGPTRPKCQRWIGAVRLPRP